MTYVTVIQNVETRAFDVLITFDESLPGQIIGWGHSDIEPDGIAKWRVISCTQKEFC